MIRKGAEKKLDSDIFGFLNESIFLMGPYRYDALKVEYNSDMLNVVTGMVSFSDDSADNCRICRLSCILNKIKSRNLCNLLRILRYFGISEFAPEME